MKAGFNVISIIPKIGRHGSQAFTGSVFLELVKPEVAVISAGLGNRYGRLHQEILDKSANIDLVVYRADLDSSVSNHY